MAQQALRRARTSPTAVILASKGYNFFNSSFRGSAQSRSGETLGQYLELRWEAPRFMTVLARTAVGVCFDETISIYRRARSTTKGELLSLDLLSIRNRKTASAW